MKKAILIFLFWMPFCAISAQIDGELLLGLTPVANAEIGSITTPLEGSIFYNSDEKNIYLNTGAGFVKIPSIDTNSIDFWGLSGDAGKNPLLNFLGTTDAQDMLFKANNEERIRLSGSNQTVLINGASQFGNHPFAIRANVDDIMAFQTSAGVTEWQWNLVGNGLNFVESGVADYRIFMEQGGNIGINTGSPTERLDVNGALRLRNITTTSTDLDVLVTTATGVVQKRTFTDFTGPTGSPKLNFGARWTNSDTTTNLNVNNGIAPLFGAENYKDDGTDLYEVSGNTLIVKEAGRYQIIANLALLGINSFGTSEQRTNVNARIAIQGTPIGALAASGYIRYTINHTNSSIHLNEILELEANDVISIVTFREANTGIVRFSGANQSSFMINKLR